jgi:hypothetical protein
MSITPKNNLKLFDTLKHTAGQKPGSVVKSPENSQNVLRAIGVKRLINLPKNAQEGPVTSTFRTEFEFGEKKSNLVLWNPRFGLSPDKAPAFFKNSSCFES